LAKESNPAKISTNSSRKFIAWSVPSLCSKGSGPGRVDPSQRAPNSAGRAGVSMSVPVAPEIDRLTACLL